MSYETEPYELKFLPWYLKVYLAREWARGEETGEEAKRERTSQLWAHTLGPLNAPIQSEAVFKVSDKISWFQNKCGITWEQTEISALWFRLRHKMHLQNSVYQLLFRIYAFL